MTKDPPELHDLVAWFVGFFDGEVKPIGADNVGAVPNRWRGANVKVIRTTDPAEQDEE